MNSFTPGILIALLILFLLGILVGYALVQRRLRKQAEELKITQRRLTEIEQSHELRLRDATEQLRHDYESQLAHTIEHYQDQLSQKTIEMEQIYETRFRVLQQGGMAATAQPLATVSAAQSVANSSRQVTPDQYRGVEPIADDSPQALTQPELMHLKRQYELRLKEATQKLQKAYETKLAEYAKTTRADIQAEYERQLAEKYQALEREFADRQAELEQEIAELRSEAEAMQSLTLSNPDLPTPSQIMGTGDETTVTLATPAPPGEMPVSAPAAQYTESELAERVQTATEEVQAEFDRRLEEQVRTATQQAQADFEQRLEAQVQTATQQAQAEFDRRLEEQLEAQQVQFDRRFKALETEYKEKLAELENAAPEAMLSPVDELFGEENYDELSIDAESASTEDEISEIADDLFGEDDFFSTTPPDKPANADDSEDVGSNLEDDLFADDFFSATPEENSARSSDDDDDFKPLDLSDIG